MTATVATVATATASAIRLAGRTAKPGADSAAGATTALTRTPYPAPASTPSPSGSACGRRAATSSPVKGMTGIRSGSTLSEASVASPRASPPSAAVAMLGDSQSGHRHRPGYLDRQPGPGRALSESATRHRPPSSSSWASGWVNADRLTYCSGRATARTRAAGGAHWGPASRPARPPKVSTARAPSTGLTSSAVDMP